MEFLPTKIPDVVLIKPVVFSDQRGFFLETYQEETFQAGGVMHRFVQDNHSRSRQRVLRGLHYQIRQAQGKLVRVVTGEVFDVAVDLRRESPTFGCWIGELLSAENHHQLWIPPGFAHGFYTLSPQADVIYKVTDFYAPTWDRTLLWNDPDLGIEWPLLSGQSPILSEKDAAGVRFKDADIYQEGAL